MENNSFLGGSSNDGSMPLTPQARAFLRETAKWAKFLSILGFIMMFFLVVVGLFMGAIMGATYGNMGGAPGLPSWFFSFIYLVMAAIYFAPMYFLYQFSSKTGTALDTNDSMLLTESLEFLKSHYKYIGILMIILLSIYALVIVFAIFAGLSSLL